MDDIIICIDEDNNESEKKGSSDDIVIDILDDPEYNIFPSSVKYNFPQKKDTISIQSWDIGIHNLSNVIEEFSRKKMEELKKYVIENNLHNTKKTTNRRRYDSNGELTPIFSKVIFDTFKNGHITFIDKKNLSTKKGVEFDLQTFINLSDYLLSIKKHIDGCDIILIEQQLKKNPMAQRLEQHIISWLTIHYLNTKLIIVYPSRNKTRILGAPKRVPKSFLGKHYLIKEIQDEEPSKVHRGKTDEKTMKMSKTQRKKWACLIAHRILNMRDDELILNYIFTLNKSKKDDLSDVIIQLQSFKILYFIDGLIR